MPTYSYKCHECEHTYDSFQSIKDEPHTSCPECSGKVIRLIGSGAGIVFKGSGFYVTDYRKQDKASDDSKSNSSDAKESSSGKTEKTTKAETNQSASQGKSGSSNSGSTNGQSKSRTD